MRIRKADAQAVIPDLAPLPNDPHPYLGPLRTAKGRRAFNHYFWPTWQVIAESELPGRWDFRWRLEIVELNDGRFATCGSVHSIERDRTIYERRCNFPDRVSAIRAVAGRLIRVAKASARQWEEWVGGLDEERAATLIHWARCVAAREAGKPEPKRLPLRPLPAKPKPPPDFTDMPLFAAT